jgi:hypothetical protein
MISDICAVVCAAWDSDAKSLNFAVAIFERGKLPMPV